MSHKEFRTSVDEALRGNNKKLVLQAVVYLVVTGALFFAGRYIGQYAWYAVLVIAIIWGWVLIDGYTNARRVARNKYVVLNDRAFILRDKQDVEDVVVPYSQLELYKVLWNNEEVEEIQLRYHGSHIIKLRWFENMGMLHDAISQRVPSNHR